MSQLSNNLFKQGAGLLQKFMKMPPTEIGL